MHVRMYVCVGSKVSMDAEQRVVLTHAHMHTYTYIYVCIAYIYACMLVEWQMGKC